MKITLFEKKFDFYTAWDIEDKIRAEIKFELLLNKHCIFTFLASVPNKSFNYRNPVKALMMALESQSVGMLKYDRLKDRIRDMKQWQNL